MAQIAKTGAGKATGTAKDATDNVAELRQRAVDQTAERAADAARHGAETVQRAAGAAREAQRELTQLSTAGTNELGRMFVELASEQARQNVETLRALSRAVDWNWFIKAVDWQQVLEIQSAYLERAAQLTRRYVEVSQAVMTSAASAAQHQAKKAA